MILVALPWLLPIAGGLSLCVLYERGEPLGLVGYCILFGMFAPLGILVVVALVLSWWRPYLDVNCTWCGRRFFATDLPAIRHSGCCPDCGKPVPREDFEDREQSS